MQLPRLRRTFGAALTLCAALLAGTAASAQQTPYTIQGTVVDATSRPLADAAVMLRGTQSRTVTGANGQFTLTARVAPGTYTLQFSALGRGEATRTVTLGADRTVQVSAVTLQESAVQLEGIVVTGTGAPVERRQVGNTVSTVSGEAINQSPAATSVDRALQGKVTGAVISQNSGAPGGGTTIRLRGTSSILGGADPLIVIDGVIVDNNSDALISLGSNASRQGSAVSNRLSDVAPGDIERVEVLKGAAAAALYGSRANNGVIQIFTRRGRGGTPQISFQSEATQGVRPREFPILMAPVASPGDVAFLGRRLGDTITRYNAQPQLFRTAYSTNNQLSLSGGNEGTSYYLSGGWIDEQGIIRTTGHDKRNVRLKLTQQVSSALEVTGSGSYIQSRTRYQPEGEQTQGALTAVLFTPTGFNPAFDPALGRYPYSPIVVANPLQVLRDLRAESNVDRIIGSVQASFKPFTNFSLNYLFGLDDSREADLYLQPPYSTGPGFTGSISNPVRSIRKYNTDLTANYDLPLTSALELTSTAGLRYTSDHNNVVRAGAENLPPGQETVGGATQFASQSLVELRTFGGFLQERLALSDQLFVTGGLNVEASSAFGRNERWQYFPRAGFSYVVSEAPFWQGTGVSGVLNTLRLRGAYGQTGGQPPAAYTIFNNYIDANFSGRPGQVASDILANPNLRPERQREFEGGFDLGLFRDRAQLEFTYYDQRTTDLVLQVPLQPSSGYSTQYQNIGVVSNKGIELALSANLLHRGPFSWDSRFQYGRNRNRVEQLRTTGDTIVFEYLNAVIVGQPVGVFYGAKYPRDANGNILYRDPNGNFTTDPAVGRPYRARDAAGNVVRGVIGDPNPDFTASLNNNLSLGDHLQLSFLLDGRFGNDVANFTRRIQEYFGLYPTNEREALKEVPSGYYTLNAERHVLYEAFVEDGSFVKLREAALRYRFDQPWVRRFGAETIDLRVAGRNLHTWTKYSGLDPEINLFGGSTVARGVDFVTTPIPRTVTVGIGVNF